MSAPAIADRLIRALRARARATWGARVYGQRRGVLDLARLLIRHLVRCATERAGFSQVKLARLLDAPLRSVKRWIAVLRGLGLIEVVTVEPGGLSYDGDGARNLHLEYRISDELRALALGLPNGDKLTANMTPDPLERSRSTNLSQRARDVPNLAPPPSASTRGGWQAPRPAPAKAAMPPPDRSKRGPGSLEEQAIRQHRRLTDPNKSERIPIADDERRTIAPFLAGLDGTPEDKLRQAAAVSRLALQDSQGRAPTLGFTYGHPPDKEPGHYGRVRLARLRELKHERHKSRLQRGAQAIARAVFSRPKPSELLPPAEMAKLGTEIMETLRPGLGMQGMGRRR